MTLMVGCNRPVTWQVEFAAVCQALVVVLELFRIGNAITVTVPIPTTYTLSLQPKSGWVR